MSQNVDRFVEKFAESIASETFIKATLGNYKGSDPHLQKINLRLITTKKGPRIYVLYKYDTRDTAKNYDHAQGVDIVRGMFADGFKSGHLFTTECDLQLDIGKKGNARLNTSKPSFSNKISTDHNREKTTLIDTAAFYLKALGITDDNGRIRDKSQDKWRQINKFVETVVSLIERSRLKGSKTLRIVDMGSGKGYLTFALYDHLSNERGIDVKMTGVEARSELVQIANDVAAACGFDGLSFNCGTIDSFDASGANILIALHACNTATDDALFKGISVGSDLIIAAPCCHQEIRPQIEPPAMMKDILKHGVMLERVAETMTDGLRALLLEREGYASKLFEFISVEHTPKNNMLVGTRLDRPGDTSRFADEIAEIKSFYGIGHCHLEELLKKNAETATAK